jgi:hypothetical protein
MGKFLFSVLLLVAGTTSLMSQSIKINYKPGSVSKEELEMDSYPLDTTASAVLLAKTYEVKVSFDQRLSLKRTETVYKRYKVLKDAGKDCADQSLLYLADNRFDESIYGIKVTTYNRENGKTVTSKLSSKLIFKDSFSDKFKKVSFSAPDVRVGSVIEVQYSFTSSLFANVGVLFMQEDYPLNHGKISVEYADYFSFNKFVRGHESFSRTENTENMEVIAFPGVEPLRFAMKEDIFYADDVPAMKKESYCFYPDQARLGVEYELRNVNIPGQYYQNYNTSWEEVDKQFIKDGYVKEFKVKNVLTTRIYPKIEGITDEVKLLEAVRKEVVSAVKWNGNVSMYPDVSKAVKEMTGDSADLCGIMASVLNGIGYTASPVLVKSRSRGVLASFHVAADAFDAVILQITTPSGKVFYTDVASRNAYLNVLPEDYLVEKARVLPISEALGYWVDLRKLSNNSYTQNYVARLSSDGRIEGDVRITTMNEDSRGAKQAFSNAKNEEEFIEQLELSYGAEVSDFSFVGNKEWSPKSVESFKVETTADVAGEYVYIKPFIKQFHSERDFQDPVRRNNIDFSYPDNIRYSFSITFPEDMVVDQLPQSQAIAFDKLRSKAIVKYAPIGDNGVMMTFIYTRVDTLLPAAEYEAVRQYWADLCSIYNATIVLKKK